MSNKGIKVKIDGEGGQSSPTRKRFEEELEILNNTNIEEDAIKISRLIKSKYDSKEWISEIIFPIRERWSREIINQGLSEQIYNVFLNSTLAFPADVDKITDNLFLGNYKSSENFDFLIKNKIRRVICVGSFYKSPEVIKFYGQNKIEHIHIWIDDLESQYYPFEILKRYCDRGTKTLIHCRAGISRSVIGTVFFLLRTNQAKDLMEASRIIKSRRQIASPNIGFIIQLVNWFEKYVPSGRGQSSPRGSSGRGPSSPRESLGHPSPPGPVSGV